MNNERDCENCKHHVLKDIQTSLYDHAPKEIYGCRRWACKFEPKGEDDE